MRNKTFYAIWAALSVCILSSVTAFGATYQMNTGVSIASGIASMPTRVKGDILLVPSGTYSGGISLSSPITLQAQGPVLVNATVARGGTALNIACSDCGVTGFEFRDFGWGVGVNNSAPPARVTLKNDIFRRSGTVWINGDSWLVEGCEIDRPIVNGQPGGVEDYFGLYGNGHTIRRCYAHGLILSTDLVGDVHNDMFQMFTEGGLSWQHLTNTLIDQCIFADYLEGAWISNNAAIPNAIQNITISNCVWWGQDFTFNGSAVTTSGSVMFQSNAPGIVITNNFFHHAWNYFSLYSMGPNKVRVEGNITTDGGNAYSLLASNGGTTAWSTLDRGVLGNVFWGASTWMLPANPSPDRINVDPQYKNPAAITGAQVVGPDGIPWTADDAWRTSNPAVAAYGPQIGVTTPPPPAPTPDIIPPVVILLGANPMMLTVGQTFIDPGATATDDRDGTLTVMVTGTVNTAVAATYARTYTATDAAGNSVTKTRTVKVAASQTLPPPAAGSEWNRVRVVNPDGTFKGFRWVQTTQTDVKP